VQVAGFGDTSDPGEAACREQTRSWFETVFSVLCEDQALRVRGAGRAFKRRPHGTRVSGMGLGSARVGRRGAVKRLGGCGCDGC
jgi:hypothetical protein